MLNSVQTGLIFRLELQAALASAFSQFRYTSVIKIAASVEYDFCDALCYCLFRNHLTDFASCCLVAAIALEGCAVSRSGNQCFTCNVVNDLRIDMRIAAINTKARTIGGSADLFAHALVTDLANLVAITLIKHLRLPPSLFLTGFAFLAEQYRGKGNVAHLEDGLSPAGVRDLADAIAAVCGGRAAVFSGNGETWNICMLHPGGDLSPVITRLKAAFPTRGGGKPGTFQGTVQGSRQQIEALFADLEA